MPSIPSARSTAGSPTSIAAPAWGWRWSKNLVELHGGAPFVAVEASSDQGTDIAAIFPGEPVSAR